MADCKFVQEEHSLLDAGLISCKIHGNVTNDFCEACDYEKCHQGKTMPKIDDANLDAIKRRLAGIPYQPHRWMPRGGGIEKFTTAYCTKCNIVIYSCKDFLDTEGLVKFWRNLRDRRDCE